MDTLLAALNSPWVALCFIVLVVAVGAVIVVHQMNEHEWRDKHDERYYQRWLTLLPTEDYICDSCHRGTIRKVVRPALPSPEALQDVVKRQPRSLEAAAKD